MKRYKRNKHIVYSNKYHVVWCPKYRRAVLSNKVGYRLKDIIYQVAAETMSDIIEIMPDHVHLLCEVDPQFGIHQFIKLIKGRSSRQLRMEFPQIKNKASALWTHAYFLSTDGGAPLNSIKQ